MRKRFGILQKAFPPRGTRAAALFRRPAKTWRMFHAAGRKRGLQVLFFRSEDVDFRRRRIHAWSTESEDGNTGWNRAWHPFPDVLYENYPVGVRGRGIGARPVKARMAKLGIPVFNPFFFNKAKLHKLLNENSEIASHLPESISATRVSDILALLNKHSFIYLKPIRGSQGKGIVEIRQTGANRYAVRTSGPAAKGLRDITMTEARLRAFCLRRLRKGKYLAQQGLDLIRRGDRKIDFRVVVHRGEDGQWHGAGIRPKLGRPGSIVTNSHAGGTKTTWEELRAWADLSGTLLPAAEHLVKPAILAVKYLTRFRPTLSHLGIDVAVDRKGGIYLLDFNEIPGRDLLTPSMLKRVTDLTAGFASYLAAQGRPPARIGAVKHKLR
ncbi:YheC/YheD family protein [Cohnella candidum]|uniref:YheC/YheD family protein n=1 Tax=Cohnella candidum TaxID=2674991 RepID=A0A3G3JVF5_9BACL|nr:YheC/YheD family protein [Cohnella candidum]AYQ72228.1 hypothetical protein EAV92_06375 [Cohnella candidum]